MTVYVDDMQASCGQMIMCHLIADTRQELLDMVDLIGVRRRWIQNFGTIKEHFDICKSNRAKAIEHGAIEVTQQKLISMIKKRR